MKTEFIHDFGSFKMVLDKTDKDMSEQIARFGKYKDEEIQSSLMRKHLRQGMTVLDIGANIGFYTILARSSCHGLTIMNRKTRTLE